VDIIHKLAAIIVPIGVIRCKKHIKNMADSNFGSLELVNIAKIMAIGILMKLVFQYKMVCDFWIY